MPRASRARTAQPASPRPSRSRCGRHTADGHARRRAHPVRRLCDGAERGCALPASAAGCVVVRGRRGLSGAGADRMVRPGASRASRSSGSRARALSRGRRGPERAADPPGTRRARDRDGWRSRQGAVPDGARGARLRDRIIVRERARGSAPSSMPHWSAAGAAGLDVVFDAIAGPYFSPAYMRLRPEGRHVIYGAADYMTHGARPDYLRLLPRYLRRPRLDPVQMIAREPQRARLQPHLALGCRRPPRLRLRRARGSDHQRRPSLDGRSPSTPCLRRCGGCRAGRVWGRWWSTDVTCNAQCTMHNAQNRTDDRSGSSSASCIHAFALRILALCIVHSAARPCKWRRLSRGGSPSVEAATGTG